MSKTAFQKSDNELWNLLQKSSKVAFSALYKRHVQSLLNFGFKFTTNQELIKDTLQELFIEFWNKRASLSDVKHVKVYIMKSFRYKLLRAISKSYKARTYSFEELFIDIPEFEDKDYEAAKARRKRLKKALLQLPKRQREAIHLRYFQNLKNDEIAEIIDINYQSVSNLLQRAILKLKANLVNSKDEFPVQ